MSSTTRELKETRVNNSGQLILKDRKFLKNEIIAERLQGFLRTE